MTIIEPSTIPPWLVEEVEGYFMPLSFTPTSILDIGANIGAFAARARRQWPEAWIICCEPMPFNVVHLRRNSPQKTAIISAAIREHSGIDEIFIGDNFVTGGFVQTGRQTQRKLLVECLAARSLPSCELVKIDTEGSELEILRGLPLAQTRAIWLEHHSRADAEAIKTLLAPQFDLVGSDAGGDLGTLRFLRR